MVPRPALLALLLVAPAVVVVAEGSTYERDDVRGPGTWLASTADAYVVALLQGESLRVTLAWDDPAARLDLSLTGASAQGCAATDVVCRAGVDCGLRGDRPLLGSPIMLEYVAPLAADVTLNVWPGLVARDVPYHLSVSVDGAGWDRVTPVGETGLKVSAVGVVACLP